MLAKLHAQSPFRLGARYMRQYCEKWLNADSFRRQWDNAHAVTSLGSPYVASKCCANSTRYALSVFGIVLVQLDAKNVSG